MQEKSATENEVATLQPQTYTSWSPEPGWLFLLPSRIAEKTQGGILLPESATKKANSGICIAQGYIPGETENHFLGKECLFPQHTEYKVEDTDTGYTLYLLPADKVIMVRIPPKEIFEFSRKKTQGLSFEETTLEHSKKD